MHEGTLYLRPSLLLSALALSLFSSSSSWCSELYLAPPPSTPPPLRTDGARQPAKAMTALKQSRSSSLHSGSQLEKKNNKNNQADQPKGLEETGRTRTGALPWTHTLQPHTHTHTKKGHRGRCYNYADDIHLMMTFPQTQTREIIR